MMELNKDIEDRHSYPLMPQEHRWIYNKLSVAEVLGYSCGPSGQEIKTPGTYCIRPIMNFAGYGNGGVEKFQTNQTQKSIAQPDYRAGYFWCEWFNGWHGWTSFTDDEPVFETGGFEANDQIRLKFNHAPTIEMPDSLKGISKYMLIEHIGGKIIEVSPRHEEFRYDPPRPLMYKIHDEENGFRWETKYFNT